MVFWCKGNNKTKRSHSPPASNRALSTHVERSINSEEFTLVLKTRLLRGKISYDEKDVKVRLKGWTAPQKMADNLLREWHTINNVELSVYRENKTGNDRTVVTEDLESRVSGLGESFKGLLGRVGLPSCVGERVAEGTNISAELSVYRENKTGKERTVVRDLKSRSKSALGQSGLTSIRERVADGANAMGTEKDEDMADEEGPFILVSPGDLQCLQGKRDLMCNGKKE